MTGSPRYSRPATARQLEVAAVMIWRGYFTPMTDSEVLARYNKVAKYPTSRGSLVDKLNALERRGLVETVDDGPPRRRAITNRGVSAVTQEREKLA